MPYKIESIGNGRYKVINAITGKVHARNTSKNNAERQVRLMEAYDNNPGWRGHRARRNSRLYHNSTLAEFGSISNLYDYRLDKA